MAACPSCGAEGPVDAPCPGCGAHPLAAAATERPSLELDMPVRKAPKPPPPPKPAEARIELAVDPRSFGHQAPVGDPSPGPAHYAEGSAAGPKVAAQPPSVQLAKPIRRPVDTGAQDIAADARALADYGSAPKRWFLSPFYAWRVLQRQRVIKLTLASRREEAERATDEAQAALEAFAARVRPVAEKEPAYATAFGELRRAEEVLRSRDRVLAAERDTQSARLASLDARMVKLDAELTQCQSDERTIAADVAATEGALAAEEAKMKRVEIELRAAQRREAGGTRP